MALIPSQHGRANPWAVAKVARDSKSMKHFVPGVVLSLKAILVYVAFFAFIVLLLFLID